MIKIKICGLKREEDIAVVNKYKPDYIGFVLAYNKKRTIDIETVKRLYSLLDKNILAVGVFLDQDIEYIKEALPYIDVIQLHGSESEDYIKNLKKYTSKPIIKAYNDYVLADYILVDNALPGTGIKASWDSIDRFNNPVFLAGGVNIFNIDEALALNPYCIDVSTGVETDGFKDEAKIKELIEKVRLYDKR